MFFYSSSANHVNISGISLDSLLVGVNFTKYYRYLGSLTTPNCNEAVIWTVFKDPIKVSKNLVSAINMRDHLDHQGFALLTGFRFLSARLTVSATQCTSQTAAHRFSWAMSSETSSQTSPSKLSHHHRRHHHHPQWPTLWGWSSSAWFCGRVRAANKFRFSWRLSGCCWANTMLGRIYLLLHMTCLNLANKKTKKN